MFKPSNIMDTISPFNYLAIGLLESLGNSNPTQQQIILIEDLLSMVTIKHKFNFTAKLNGKEIACLYWAAHGKSSKETAALLHINQSTVESHRKEIKRKLGCSSMTQAVFQGIRYGYYFGTEFYASAILP